MKRILLVEDDIDVRPLLEHVLLGEGYRVAAAATATEARLLLDTQPFDLVLADGKLPDGDGIAVADAAVRLGIKALIISAYIFQLPSAGLSRHEYLLKPIRYAELLARVARKLDERL